MSVIIDGAGTIAGLSATGISAQPVFAGQVLQVVNVEIPTPNITVTTTTYTSVGLSAAITLSSTQNKVFVQVSLPCEIFRSVGGEQNGKIRVLRNGIEVIEQPRALSRIGAINPGSPQVAAVGGIPLIAYYDSPNSTSSLTYSVEMAPLTTLDSGNIRSITGNATITLMEIAG